MTSSFLLPVGFDLVPLTLIAFGITLAFCAAGLFYSGYQENWLQTIGMIAVGIAAFLQMTRIRMVDYASGETALLAVGLAIFAAGVAWKVWTHSRPSRYEPPRTLSKRRTQA